MSPSNINDKLNRNILYHIFSLNTVWHAEESDPWRHRQRGVAPLNSTRAASQVCQTWRETLLHSPVIWGKCMELDVLSKGNSNWSNLVLQRTQTSGLEITGGWLIGPGSRISDFLLNLVHTEHERIIKLFIYLEQPLMIDTRFVTALGQRWSVLRTMRVRTPSREFDEPAVTTTDHVHLFSSHAPCLAELDIEGSHGFSLKPKASSSLFAMFNRNLRHLNLIDFPLVLSDKDLLSALAQMPWIETFNINLSVFRLSSPLPGDTLHQSLPYLKQINIHCPNLDIYPRFLAHIYPQQGCSLSVTTLFKEDLRDQYGSPEREDRYSATQSVIQRFMESAVKHQEQLFSRQIAKAFVEIDIGSSVHIWARYPKSYEDPYFMNIVSTEHNLPTEIFTMILDLVSSITFPEPPRQLSLLIRGDYNILLDMPALEQFFSVSFHGTTKLVATSPLSLSFLEDFQDSRGVNLFSCLTTLEVPLPDKYDNIDILLHPDLERFLRRRYNSQAPLEILELHEYIEPGPDMCYLDQFVGLKFALEPLDVESWSWKLAKPESYVCGSGDINEFLTKLVEQDYHWSSI